MSGPKKRPGLLWRFFYGRRRRGFPWLLVGVLAALAQGAASDAANAAEKRDWETLRALAERHAGSVFRQAEDAAYGGHAADRFSLPV